MYGSKRVGFIIIVTVSLYFNGVLPAHAAIDTWLKGASITPTTTISFQSDSFYQSLADLKSTNANSVSLVIPIYQDNLKSTTIHAGGNTPTDASLIAAIKKAHSLGLAVALKPHLDPLSGEWRAYIDPVDRDAWFNAYDTILLHYLAIAESNQVELVVIGTELIDLSTDDHNVGNTAAWRKIISDVRSTYSGKITYAANWGAGWAAEKDHIAFFDALDYAGVDAYYPLGIDASDTSVTSFINAWSNWDTNDFTPFAKKIEKPILFTEVGYKSSNGAHVSPEDYKLSGGYNATVQANAYTALFSYWNQDPRLSGMSIWQWGDAATYGGEGNQDYTPQHKPAQAIIKAWYGGTVTAVVLPKVSVVSTALSQTGLVNQPQVITAHVSNAGGSVTAGLIDVEVYDHLGKKVFQQFLENQIFSATSTTYTISWTPTSAGTYTVKMGAFMSDWSTVYGWNDSAETITIGTSVPVTPASFIVTATPTHYSALNQPITLALQVKNTEGTVSALVDVEIYASSGQKVFQHFYDDQSFGSYETKNFFEHWTPNKFDTYHVSVGVFSPHWNSSYEWTANVADIAYEAQTIVPPIPIPTPTPSPLPTTSIDIWWPSSSTPVTGTQLFKAVVSGQSLETYEMYWQVDGGILHPMHNSVTGYGHKEDEVSVSDWNWQGGGPYQVTFIAIDRSGSVIATNTVPVVVSL
jgi:hypothetical protein